MIWSFLQEYSQDSDMTTHNVQAMFDNVAIQNNEGTRQNNEDNTTGDEGNGSSSKHSFIVMWVGKGDQLQI